MAPPVVRVDPVPARRVWPLAGAGPAALPATYSSRSLCCYLRILASCWDSCCRAHSGHTSRIRRLPAKRASWQGLTSQVGPLTFDISPRNKATQI